MEPRRGLAHECILLMLWLASELGRRGVGLMETGSLLTLLGRRTHGRGKTLQLATMPYTVRILGRAVFRDFATARSLTARELPRIRVLRDRRLRVLRNGWGLPLTCRVR